MNRALYCILFILGACATSSKTIDVTYTSENKSVKLTTWDDMEKKSFSLELTALDGKACLSHDYWPNEFGQVSFGSDFITVKVNENSFPIRKINLGTCRHDSCYIELNLGETATAKIPYTEFETNLVGLEKTQKKLIFSELPFSGSCGSGAYKRFDETLSALIKVK